MIVLTMLLFPWVVTKIMTAPTMTEKNKTTNNNEVNKYFLSNGYCAWF